MCVCVCVCVCVRVCACVYVAVHVCVCWVRNTILYLHTIFMVLGIHFVDSVKCSGLTLACC